MTRSFDDILASKTARSSDVHVELLQENGIDFWMGLQQGLLFFPMEKYNTGAKEEEKGSEWNIREA